jgi:hypothetical protein
MSVNEEYITVNQAFRICKRSKLIDIKKATLYVWLRDYPNLGIKVGGRWRVHRPTFKKFLKGDRSFILEEHEPFI